MHLTKIHDYFWILQWEKYFMYNIWAAASRTYSLLTNSHMTEQFVKALQCFFESDLREHVHESTIPNGRRLIQVFQLDRITKEIPKKKYQHKPENELYLWGDSEHGAEASKRLIWHILTLRKQDKNNVRPYNQKEESKGKEGWGSFEVSVFAYGWVSSQGAS